MISEENLSESSHPRWFYQAFVENSFPWSNGVAMSFEEFAQKYTLHDSYWIGAFLNIAYEPTVILAIEWDAVWLPDSIKESISIVDDCAHLLGMALILKQDVATNPCEFRGCLRSVLVLMEPRIC